MWLCYIDESGNTGMRLDDPVQPTHWMGAVLVPEDQVLALSLAVDGVLSSVADVEADVELHGTEMFRGKGAWRHVPVQVRVRAFEMALALLAEHNCVIAHSSIDKTKLSAANSVATSPHLMAFQFLVEKINSFAKHQQDPLLQRVLLVADETTEHDAFAINLVAGMQRQKTMCHR